MRTLTIVTNVYKIEELTEESQERALQDFKIDDIYPSSEENKTVLKTFEDIFPITVTDWQYDEYSSYINFDFNANEDIENLTGFRLAKYIYNNYFNSIFKGKYFSLWSKKEPSLHNQKIGKLKTRYSKVIFNNNCVLTGYYMDMDILNPIYKFLKKPYIYNYNFYDIIERCLNEWIQACQRDYEAYYSLDNFIEVSEANEWEYTENGELY